MGRYFKVTEIPFEEYEKIIGEDLGTYSVLGKTVGNNYYVGVDDGIEDEFYVPLEEIPPMIVEVDDESTNSKSYDCMNCKNLGASCDVCKDNHTSNWVHDKYNIPDHKCPSCKFKYGFLTKEPCKSCEMIMESKFVLKSE